MCLLHQKRIKLKFLLVISFFVISLYSCKYDRYESYLKLYPTYLIEYSNPFPDDLVDHFPKETDSLFTFYFEKHDSSNTISRFTSNRLVLCMSVSINRAKELYKKHLETACQIINPNNKCLLIVNALQNKTANLEDEFEKLIDESNSAVDTSKYYVDTKRYLKGLENRCDTLTLPVPNFSSLVFNKINLSQGNRLTDEFTLFVISAKPGVYCDEDFLTNGDGLPEKWKNGYSKGVAINVDKGILLFWLEVW